MPRRRARRRPARCRAHRNPRPRRPGRRGGSGLRAGHGGDRQPETWRAAGLVDRRRPGFFGSRVPLCAGPCRLLRPHARRSSRLGCAQASRRFVGRRGSSAARRAFGRIPGSMRHPAHARPDGDAASSSTRADRRPSCLPAAPVLRTGAYGRPFPPPRFGSARHAAQDGGRPLARLDRPAGLRRHHRQEPVRACRTVRTGVESP